MSYLTPIGDPFPQPPPYVPLPQPQPVWSMPTAPILTQTECRLRLLAITFQDEGEAEEIYLGRVERLVMFVLHGAISV